MYFLCRLVQAAEKRQKNASWTAKSAAKVNGPALTSTIKGAHITIEGCVA